jgi:Fe-S cluster assembly protein SufD
MSLPVTTTLGKYVESFAEAEQRRAAPVWLRALRRDAFARFFELGFPTTRVEDWRFTNTAPIANTAFQVARQGAVPAEDLEAYRIAGAACQLVFVNGRYSPELSLVPALQKGITVGNLASEYERGIVDRYLARYANFRTDAFTALNTAFLEDGAFVHIGRGVVLQAPINILYVSTGKGAPQMVHPRNLIIAEENSQATVVEDYVSINSGVFFSDVVTELIAGEQAIVEHYMLEREDTQAYNISTLRIEQGRSANVASHSVLLGGALVRNNVHPVLAGEGGDCLINGLFIGTGRQHMDNYMKVEHARPHCSSRQFYNGILDGQARGVFHGRIIVHKDAQKTDAKQTNRNLLLSDDAQIDTKPQLEIYADDVKCTHGATIGQIEEEALFYMRSRGLADSEARALLLLAFAGECLERMKSEPVRAYLEGLVTHWVPRGGAAGDARSTSEVRRVMEEVL